MTFIELLFKTKITPFLKIRLAPIKRRRRRYIIILNEF